MRITLRLAALMALSASLTALPGCTPVSNSEGAERWTAISPMAATSPQLAQNDGRLSARCAGSKAGLSNATVAEDRTVYRIERGDKLHLSFYRNGELDRYVQVRPDGRFTVEPYGDIAAVGLTPGELAHKLDVLFSEDLIAPDASVSVIDSPFRKIFVGGEVNYPGMLPLRPGMTATQAIISAGWFRDDARPDQIVLIRRDACGDPYGTFVQVANAIAQNTDRRVQDVTLLPNDMLVVPRSTIGELNLFVQQYFRNMLPVQPYLSVGPPF